MDNLTHSLVAVTLSRAGLQRVCPNATLLLLIAANIPDIDIVALVKSPLAALELHAGYTHALVGLLPLAVVSVLLTRWIARAPMPFGAAHLLALLGLASHLLLDWSGSYGVRALLPFSSRWFYLDLSSYFDWVILAALLLAFAWPWFVSLVSGEIGRAVKHPGQGSAIAVLLFLTFYDVGRWYTHRQALSKLTSATYDGQSPLRVAALAEAHNPFEWTGVVETADAFRIEKIGWIELSDSRDARIFRKPAESSLYKAVIRTATFRYMLYFARFPVWKVEPAPLGSALGQHVELTDLRFGASGIFHADALADASGEVKQTSFSLRPTRQ